MFVDEVNLEIHAGDGGDGCLAFKREKYIPMGGPFGGNGGKGASIIFKVDLGLRTLLDLKYNKIIKGKKGENGQGKNQNGKSQDNVYIKVPQGTIIKDLDTGIIIADLTKEDQEVVVARGGRGGRGNTAFKTQYNPAPNFSENGEPGEVRYIKVELKMLADVGLVGFPSVGKSTIISKISKAKPKIADYHFTTLSPNLGVCKDKKNRSFTVADLPGLIEGASKGLGLGDKFLKHIERTKLIAHVIDMGNTENRDPIKDFEIINNELKSYSEKLYNKPQVIVANKMDMPNALENLEKFKKKYNLKVIEISALTNQGLDNLLIELGNYLENIKEEPLISEDIQEDHILYEFKKEDKFDIFKENENTWVVRGKEIEKLFKMANFQTDEGIKRFIKRLTKMGLNEKLESLGANDNDKVKILDYEFDYKK